MHVLGLAPGVGNTCGHYRVISDEMHDPENGAEGSAETWPGLRTSLRSVRLSHLHLRVSDVAKARTFYERWFGFEQQVQHGSTLFLRDQGGLDLALAPDPNAGPMPPWFHFGFRLDSITEVDELHTAMIEGGVDIRQPFENWGDLAAFRCADDDGYQIEVYWE